MELALISIRQVIVFFILIMTGFFAIKAKVLKPEARQHFSSLLVSIVVPCMIVNSYITEFNPEVFHGIVLAFIHSFILIMIGLVIAVHLDLWLCPGLRTDRREEGDEHDRSYAGDDCCGARPRHLPSADSGTGTDSPADLKHRRAEYPA